jgi:hypothetical protein
MSRPSLLRWRPVSRRIDRARDGEDWIENRRAPQLDEAQFLLASLCEQLHERLQQDGTPPRTVINLTVARGHQAIRDDIGGLGEASPDQKNQCRESGLSQATPRLKPLIAFGEFFLQKLIAGPAQPKPLPWFAAVETLQREQDLARLTPQRGLVAA